MPLTVITSVYCSQPSNFWGSCSSCTWHTTWLISERRSHISRSHTLDINRNDLVYAVQALRAGKKPGRKSNIIGVREWVKVHAQKASFLRWECETVLSYCAAREKKFQNHCSKVCLWKTRDWVEGLYLLLTPEKLRTQQREVDEAAQPVSSRTLIFGHEDG